MKNLFYKELKLSIHPLCYIFAFVFGFLGLIPSYPTCVAFIYTLASYTILFLGANKAATTNDLFYSLTLPIRRKDVVKARMISISFLQLLTLIPLLITLTIRCLLINPFIVNDGGETLQNVDVNQFFALIGIIGFGFSITDIIFVPWFYKTGKSIILPTLVTTFTGVIYFVGVPTLLAYIPELNDLLTIGHENANYLLQFGILLFGIGSYIFSRFLINKIASNNLEKLDY